MSFKKVTVTPLALDKIRACDTSREEDKKHSSPKGSKISELESDDGESISLSSGSKGSAAKDKKLQESEQSIDLSQVS